MEADKNLIDSLLKLDVSGNNGLSNDATKCDDSRTDIDVDYGEDAAARFRRVSDPKSPPSSDHVKYGLMMPSGGMLDPSIDSNVRSPPRYKEAAEDFASDSFAIGALARFRDGEETKPASMYQSVGDSLHEERSLSLSRSIPSRDAVDEPPYGRDYGQYDSRSRSGSNAPPVRDMYSAPQDSGPSVRVISTAPSPRNAADTPYLSQHGYAPPSNPSVAQNYRPPEHLSPTNRAAPPAPSPRHSSYHIQAPAQSVPTPQQPHHQPPPHVQQGYPRPGAPAVHDPYYGAPPDPYAGGHRPQPAYGQSRPHQYAQPYRPQPAPYAPAPHDPYGYGPPPPMQGYAPRYGKPAPAMGYRQPYGRDMPPDPYYAGGGYAPPPPQPYGYPAAPYGAPPPPQEDPYYAGAAAVNRVLGRPTGGDGYRGGGNYGNPINARLRDRALTVAEPVNLDNIDPNTIVYQVQFKKTIRNFTLRPGDPAQVVAGDFVVVQADRGEDLGVVTESYPLQTFLERRYAMRAYMDEEDQNVGYILRVASQTETKLLPEKFQDEEMIFKTCENLAVHTYRLPMTVVDVEYQFDRHKITIYYDSPVRIDFRELVRDLFSSFKARIWMKKVNQFQQPDIKHYAAMALATGVQFAPTND